MDYQEFKLKCNMLVDSLTILMDKLSVIKNDILTRDLKKYLEDKTNKPHKIVFSNKIDIDGVDEIMVDGELSTIINRDKERFFGFRIILKKGFCTVGLGLEYKGEIIAPHLSSQTDTILKKYSEVEIDEITNIIDDKIKLIKSDIQFIDKNTDLNSYKYEYENYNGIFDGDIRFKTIHDVFEYFYSI